jgi:hypothetical protein
MERRYDRSRKSGYLIAAFSGGKWKTTSGIDQVSCNSIRPLSSISRRSLLSHQSQNGDNCAVGKRNGTP